MRTSRALLRSVAAAGGAIALHVYEDAVHAFMRSSDPRVFHPEAASLAWQRTLGFFARQFGN